MLSIYGEIIMKTILIPSMLDFHFPLLKLAFNSPDIKAIILENEENITHTGLKYANNDMCYPCILIIGQMIEALKSGLYDLSSTMLLIPQAGDACRGSNYIKMIRKALKAAGYEQIPVISLNFKGLEKDSLFSFNIGMIIKAMAAIIYSDTLMILYNQTKPYEKVNGSTDKLLNNWNSKLSIDLKSTKNITIHSIRKNISEIASSFRKIEKHKLKLKKVGIAGELYVKYCHLGNWNCGEFLLSENCEYMVNGFSWYILYYIDIHKNEQSFIMNRIFNTAMKIVSSLQKHMVCEIRKNGFNCVSDFFEFKKISRDLISFECKIADGWLIGAEIINMVHEGYDRILCIQPFGCMSNHICGKGIYSYLRRMLPESKIVSIDYDSSGSSINVQNRIKFLIDM